MRPEALLNKALTGLLVCAVLATVTLTHSFAIYRAPDACPALVAYRSGVILTAFWHALRVHTDARANEDCTRGAAALLGLPAIVAIAHVIALLLCVVIRVCIEALGFSALLALLINDEARVSTDADKAAID